jgi:hypothetical protein
VYYRGCSRRSSTWWCAERLKSVSTACTGNGACSLLCRGAEIACFVRRHLALSGVMLTRLIDAATDHPESATWALEWLGSLRGVVGYLAEVSGS